MDERLKELRIERKLTQQQVSEQIGITARAYSYYESGTREPPFDILKKLCKFFEVTADYLLGLADY